MCASKETAEGASDSQKHEQPVHQKTQKKICPDRDGLDCGSRDLHFRFHQRRKPHKHAPADPGGPQLHLRQRRRSPRDRQRLIRKRRRPRKRKRHRPLALLRVRPRPHKREPLPRVPLCHPLLRRAVRCGRCGVRRQDRPYLLRRGGPGRGACAHGPPPFHQVRELQRLLLHGPGKCGRQRHRRLPRLHHPGHGHPPGPLCIPHNLLRRHAHCLLAGQPLLLLGNPARAPGDRAAEAVHHQREPRAEDPSRGHTGQHGSPRDDGRGK